MKRTRAKGNKKEQRKRRRERNKNLPERKKNKYQLIDGNYSHYPVAYCRSHKGCLTIGLIETHKCEERNCYYYDKGGDCFWI